MVGHASIRVRHGGKTILTDPWYVDPINCNTLFHWPPIVHDIDAVARETDAIYISHVHPDHLDPRTLDRFPRHVPIYIGDYREKAFRDALRDLGFSVREAPFETRVPVTGTDFTITILESDYAESAAYDSSCVIETPDFTVFNNNDCFLKTNNYEWTARNFRVDYAFLGFSPASYYPICFEFERAERDRLLLAAAERRYDDFVGAAKMLEPRVAIPFAMGIRFLHPTMLWQNVSFNSNLEAARRVGALGIRGEVLNPGDRLVASGEVIRRSPLLDDDENARALLAHAREKSAWIESIWRAEEPARPGLMGRFREYMERTWRHARERYPEVATNVIAYRIEGPEGGEISFDFSRGDDISLPGIPGRFDMRYTYVDRLLQLRLDGKIDWDELHFSNRVSVRQERYAARFYAMVREDGGLNSNAATASGHFRP
jgi:UDP-MurNAc hydroxylase